MLALTAAILGFITEFPALIIHISLDSHKLNLIEPSVFSRNQHLHITNISSSTDLKPNKVFLHIYNNIPSPANLKLTKVKVLCNITRITSSTIFYMRIYCEQGICFRQLCS